MHSLQHLVQKIYEYTVTVPSRIVDRLDPFRLPQKY
jgi:hypothetical protein